MNIRIIIFFSLLFPLMGYSSGWAIVNIDTLATVEMPSRTMNTSSNPTIKSYEVNDTSGSYTLADQSWNSKIPKTDAEFSASDKVTMHGISSSFGGLSLLSSNVSVYKGARCLNLEYKKSGGDAIYYYRSIYIGNHAVIMGFSGGSKDVAKNKRQRDRYFNSLTFVHPLGK